MLVLFFVDSATHVQDISRTTLVARIATSDLLSAGHSFIDMQKRVQPMSHSTSIEGHSLARYKFTQLYLNPIQIN